MGNLRRRLFGAAFEVHNELDHGFLERVYQKALPAELIGLGLKAQTECPIDVKYKVPLLGSFGLIC